jgi:hypothetical protein
MMLQLKITVIDLNLVLFCRDTLLSPVRRIITNEHRAYNLFTDTGFHPKTSIQNLRQSLQRQFANQNFLVFRPIFDNGFRTTDIPRKLARYRNLFKSLKKQVVSLWLSRENFSNYFSRRKREKRLANISRLCTSSYQKSKAALHRRRLWRYIKKYSLCFGCNSYRSMPVAVSMGSTSQGKKCSKASYANGPKRLDTHVCTHYKRRCTRNDSFSRRAIGAFSHICHGQGLYRLCNIIQFFKEQLLLYYQSKKECSLLSQVFSASRQEYGFTKRPNNKVNWHKNFKALPDTTEANHISRRRTTTHFCFSDQQFSTGRVDNLPALQTTLANRTFLQVDQTALANKVLFRYFYQRCQDSNLDSDQCLRACSDNQKRTKTGAFVTRNTTNYKYPTFRENYAKTSTYGKLLYS